MLVGHVSSAVIAALLAVAFAVLIVRTGRFKAFLAAASGRAALNKGA